MGIKMNYNIEKSTIEEIKPLFVSYLNTLNGVADDYWEEHIANAVFYKISIEGIEIGYFSIFNKEKITQFYMVDKYLQLAQSVFKEVLEKYQVKTAYVATCDQLFLSLCLDNHRKIEMQAYFFDGTVIGDVRSPEFGRECIIEVKPEELAQVKEKTGDFFDFVTESLLLSRENILYRLHCDEEDLGYGIIVPNKMLTKYWACGMITLENKRQKGVGRSIQIHLADICREQGYTPISGCWYYNHLSKKTIESAGRYTKTRLLNVIFD